LKSDNQPEPVIPAINSVPTNKNLSAPLTPQNNKEPLKEPSKEVTPPVLSSPKNNPLKWNVQQVCDFIKKLPGCSDYVEDFALQEIDGQALMLLQADHLMSAMSIKLGPALKICEQVKVLKDELAKNWRQAAIKNSLNQSEGGNSPLKVVSTNGKPQFCQSEMKNVQISDCADALKQDCDKGLLQSANHVIKQEIKSTNQKASNGHVKFSGEEALKIKAEPLPNQTSNLSCISSEGNFHSSKKIVLKFGKTVLAEKDYLSESDEENLVMDFSEESHE